MSKTRHIFGVDFGTANTCIAVMEENHLRLLDYISPLYFPDGTKFNPDDSFVDIESHIMPSCVHFFKNPEDKETKYVAGQEARYLLPQHPFSTIHSIKRFLGKRFDSAEIKPFLDPDSLDDRYYLGYQVKAKPGLDIHVVGENPHFDRTTIEIAKFLFDKVRGIIYHHYKEVSPYLVVGIPGKAVEDKQFQFDLARGITESKCRLVGFLSEPLATAWAYSLREDSTGKSVCILDVGAGTTDFSLVHFNKHHEPMLLHNEGDIFLGGDDFDYRIVKHAVDKYAKKTRNRKIPKGYPLIPNDPKVKYRYKDNAEKAKKNLSYEKEVTLRVPKILPRIDPNIGLEVNMTQNLLEAIVDPLVDKIVALALTVQDDSDFLLKSKVGSKAHISGILFSGGQCRMPYLRESVSKATELAPLPADYPDQSIAIGLAIYASKLGDPTNIRIRDPKEYLR